MNNTIEMESKTEFTPGPWTVDTEHTMHEAQVLGPLNDDGSHTILHAGSLANARLIASAPELLEAAKHLGRTGHRFGSVASEGCEECKAARAAIAKATGKEGV